MSILRLERRAEKWEPVFCNKRRVNKNLERASDSDLTLPALMRLYMWDSANMRVSTPMAIVVTAMVCAPAFAAIEVSPAIVIFEPKASQEAVITVDPNPTTLGILSTPAKLVLEKGERRGVRVVAVNPPGSDDRVWRVKIAPAAGKLKAGQSGVAFLIGYDALIIQRAANATVAITGQRTGKKLILSNAGNSFGMISEIRQCPTSGECVKLKDTKRLYGNSSWSVDLPQDGGTVEVNIDGINNKRETIKI
jgi:P pilus assembly chaperone PapD